MQTYPKISFGLYNLEINSDSTPEADDVQDFSKIEDLKSGNVADYAMITYEPDFWLLDGSFKFRQDDEATIHCGLMSLSMSDENGDFDVPPVLTVTFDSKHSSDGLVLHFSRASNDWADSINVEYFDIEEKSISSENYSPDSYEFAIDNVVNDFVTIVITFNSTNKAYRYLRLTAIDYGQLVYFDQEGIISANVVEQVDLISMTTPSNSIDIEIRSVDSGFSIISPTGYFARLSDRQPLDIYEMVGASQLYVGRYYLEDWDCPSATKSAFKGTDAIGVLDKIRYNGGMWHYEGIKAQYLIEEIMQVSQFPYELDVDLYDVYVIGYIPRCSCREALQQVCFAIGAYVDCSRSSLVKIRKTIILDGTEDTLPVTEAEYSSSASLSLKKLVTGIELTSHNYSQNSNVVDIFTGEFAVGFYTILTPEPCHDITITGAVIVNQSVNHVYIRVVTAGEVVISGYGYNDNKQKFTWDNPAVGVYVPKNIITVEEATLVNVYNGQEVIDRISAYYDERYIQKAKLFAPTSVYTGKPVLIDTLENAQIRGVVEKMEVNLTGGFLADCEIIGVVE